MMVLTTLWFGGLGFLDDYSKLVKQQSLGLRGWHKIGLQTLGAVAIAVYLYGWGPTAGDDVTTRTALSLPFFKAVRPELGILFIPFATLVIGRHVKRRQFNGRYGRLGNRLHAVCRWHVRRAWIHDKPRTYCGISEHFPSAREWRSRDDFLRGVSRGRVRGFCGITRIPRRCSWGIPVPSPSARRSAPSPC